MIRYSFHKLKYITFFVIYFFLLTRCVYAQNTLSGMVEKLKSDPALIGASWSILAVYADAKDTLANYNEQTALPPASVMKTVSTAAALQILGSDYTFKTRLYISGDITEDGILNGNLILQGGGDPTLGSDKWKEGAKDSLLLNVYRTLVANGIKMINGNIIADASVFEEVMAAPGWNWGDIGNYYGAGPSGLTVCDNLLVYCFKSGENGEKTTIFKTVPEISDIQVRNYVTAGGKGDNAYVFGSEYANIRYIQGTIPAKSDSFCVKGNIPDPPKFAASMTKDALERYHIPVMGWAQTDRSLDTSIEYAGQSLRGLAQWSSPPLSEIISVINMSSNNLYAEHVHKAVSAYKNGKGTNAGSNKIITDFWVSKGLDANALFMTDGSGLSRSNAISTSNLVKMLRLAAEHKTSGIFIKSLPIAGRSGTLKSMCRGTKAQGNIAAKSGTMTRIKAYAGYATAANGRPVVFAMIFNNYACSNSEITAKIEKLMVQMAEAK